MAEQKTFLIPNIENFTSILVEPSNAFNAICLNPKEKIELGDKICKRGGGRFVVVDNWLDTERTGVP